MEQSYALLLTATIDLSKYPGVNTYVTDFDERKNQYYECIEKYITDSAFTDIVFAENSNYCYDPADYNRFLALAEKNNKRFEWVSCDIHEETGVYGKGCGESFIIEEALRRSKLLEGVETVYKVTGRYFLTNSHSIVKSCSNHKNEFLVSCRTSWCITYFFKICIKDFLPVFSYFNSHLQEAHLENNCVIENTLYNYFTTKLDPDTDIGCFKVWPRINAVSGSSGGSCAKSGFEYFCRDILCGLNAFEMDSVFQKIFAVLPF